MDAEAVIGRRKNFRHFAARYDWRTIPLFGSVHLAAAVIWSR